MICRYLYAFNLDQRSISLSFANSVGAAGADSVGVVGADSAGIDSVEAAVADSAGVRLLIRPVSFC